MGDGMKQVTFISGLKKELVRVGSFDEVRYHGIDTPAIAMDDVLLFGIESVVETKIAPVLHICTAGREDVYVAYSEEVEKLLGIPIRCIIKEKERAVKERDRAMAETRRLQWWKHRVTRLSTWSRLKFLFTRRLPE